MQKKAYISKVKTLVLVPPLNLNIKFVLRFNKHTIKVKKFKTNANVYKLQHWDFSIKVLISFCMAVFAHYSHIQ